MYEQTELFEVHKNISNNLIPGEVILYQLKSYEYSYGSYFEYQLYITNKRIYIIHYPNRSGEIIEHFSFDDLQGITFRKKKNADDFGEIEFISEKIYTRVKFRDEKVHSRFFNVHDNLSYIIKIIESILWYYSDVNKRLERLRNEKSVQIPNEFKNFFKTNKVFVPQKKSPEGIEFNQNIYLTYSDVDWKIIIKPTYDSKIKIRYETSKYTLKELELIYFLTLYWKFKNNSLLTKEDLLELQKRFRPKEERLNRDFNLQKEPNKYNDKHYYYDRLENYNQSSRFLEKLYIQFKSYLNKDEKMLLYYKEKIFNKLALIIIFFTLISIFSIYLMIYSFFLSIYGLQALSFLLFLVSTPGLIFLPFIFKFSFKSCLCTSQKIIFRKLRKIGTTHYNNFSSITYNNNKYSQNIYFHLKESMDSNDFKNKTSFSLNFIPKKLNLYDKIIELRNQFKS